MTKQVTGAALVVGGGIAGMQAALDLAESGFYVYLVEKSPSIGGTMARLDKTFPTNDCAMCILSPKLVECGRHLNIEVLTGAEVMDVAGEPGNFIVQVRRHPRYIDVSRCTGCGDCERECPVRRPNENEGGLNLRKAVFRPFPQAYPNAFAIEKAERPMCQVSCPAGVHAQGYVALVAEGKFKEAVALVRRHNPLPAVCGRVCHHPCEAACRRGLLDEPVAIRPLKRFIADYEHEHGGAPELIPAGPRPEKVAVVGSGPAGLTCAHFLALGGFKVTVFEALPVAGGMLAVGIPDYRLPPDILRTEIGQIEGLGVEIRTGTALGRDFSLDDLRAQGYGAVFLAVGAHLDQKLGMTGEDLPGVVSGVEFLRRINLGDAVEVGRRVLVIGGGNVAIDAARSCLRLGANEVTVVYRRSRGEMPAAAHEVHAAAEEGIGFEFLTAPAAVIGQGKVEGLRCVRMRLGEADASGRRRPVPVPGSDFTLEADQVIVAIGQSAGTAFAGEGLVDRRGNLAADPATLATCIPGVFAGGDAVTGPATVVEAIRAGRQAAVSIRRHLDGEDLAGGVIEGIAPVVGQVPWEAERVPRAALPELEPAARRRDFNEVEGSLSRETAVAEARRCLDCGICAECLECERVCRAGAVVHGMREETVELKVGAVVLCPGFATTEPERLLHLGYRRFPNVVTSMEFERILSASGPYEGHVVRPSDRKTPQSIAFLQCVGSRDLRNGESYCSSVCCMYALKEAVIAKEHCAEDLEITIFYMDLRAYGKDFERYLNRAQDEYGVRLVRAKVETVESGSAPGGLTVRYAGEDGSPGREEFDLVVLSVGMRPAPEVVALARRLGMGTDEHGFPRAVPGKPTHTSLPGVLVAGPFAGPKDIPETVVEASAAAAGAAAVLAPGRGDLVRRKEYPPERPVANRAPRVGVFVCHCGINIGGVVRVGEVVEYARRLPGVVYAEENLYTCSQDTQDRIKQLIEEHDLNRVVVASCSPRTHEPLFQQTIREGGLNPYLFEMANIRDQCSWVHMHEPDAATAKSRDLVAMAVAKARHLAPLYQVPVPVTAGALVVGGGMAGLTAALGFARQGFPACLVERDPELGGQARRLKATLEGEDVPALVAAAIREAQAHPLVTIYTGARVRSVEGFVGNFESVIATPGGEVSLKHGVVVVATGARPAVPAGYGFGEDPRVVTLLELEESLDAVPPGNVVMIGCAGSREEGRPYCSRVCCSQMVKNALALRRRYPDREVYVLYRDIRTYGLKEDHYRLARGQGVTFLRYRPDDPPVVTTVDGQLQVRVTDEVLGEPVIIPAGLVALAAGIEPPGDARVLAQALKVPLNADGFFLEAHAKLRPVDFATDGVFVAGLAHAPKTLAESVAQALAAVGRAVTVIARDSIAAGGMVAEVRESRCSGCRTCESVCQYQAIKVDPAKGKAAVEKAVCKGCGACAATCWCGAIGLAGFTEEQILAEVAALL